MPALTDNICAGIVNKHLILKITASTAIPKNVQPSYYNWARSSISLLQIFCLDGKTYHQLWYPRSMSLLCGDQLHFSASLHR